MRLAKNCLGGVQEGKKETVYRNRKDRKHMDDINIAMLIDADNVSSRYIPGILSELSK